MVLEKKNNDGNAMERDMMMGGGRRGRIGTRRAIAQTAGGGQDRAKIGGISCRAKSVQPCLAHNLPLQGGKSSIGNWMGTRSEIRKDAVRRTTNALIRQFGRSTLEKAPVITLQYQAMQRRAPFSELFGPEGKKLPSVCEAWQA